MRKRQRGFAPVIAIIIVSVIALSAYFVLKEKLPTQSTQPQQSVGVIAFSSNTPDQIIQQLEEHLNKTTSYHFEEGWRSWWWISPDGWNIYDENAPSTTTKIVVEESESDTKAKLQEAFTLNHSIGEHLLKNGFRKNSQNSSTSVEDDRFYDYVQAFEKDKTLCTVTTDPDISGSSGDEKMGHYATVSCSDQLDKLYQEHVPYLKGLKMARR